MNVKKNIGSQTASDGEVCLAIKKLRKEVLGTDQKGFARLLGVSQAIVSQWESGKYEPSPMALMAIGRIDAPNKDFWFEKAGPFYSDLERTVDAYKRAHPGWEEKGPSNRPVPLLVREADAVALEDIKEDQIERILLIPREWLPAGDKMFALYVKEDGMSPTIENGFIVIVDAAKRDPKLLLNKMVMAKDEDGVKIRWLMRDLGMYLLTPQDMQRHRMTELSIQKGHCVVGEVVRYIGQPTRSWKKAV